jgi:hypothetical protein
VEHALNNDEAILEQRRYIIVDTGSSDVSKDIAKTTVPASLTCPGPSASPLHATSPSAMLTAEMLPPPVFDAGLRLREIYAWENRLNEQFALQG